MIRLRSQNHKVQADNPFKFKRLFITSLTTQARTMRQSPVSPQPCRTYSPVSVAIKLHCAALSIEHLNPSADTAD